METDQTTSFAQKTFQEKKDFIIKSIVDGYKTRPNKDDHVFNLRIRLHKGLTDQDLDDVSAILHALEKKDNVIVVESFDYPTPLFTGGAKLTTPRYDLLVRLKITKDIQNWYSAYLYEKNQKLEDLDLLQLENIYNTVLDIEGRLRIKPSTKVTIKLNQECRFPLLAEKCDGLLHSAEYREDALIFLARKNIITDFKIRYSEYGDNEVDLFLNFNKFQQFNDEIGKVHKNLNNDNSSNDKILYNVTYNEMAGEILINNKVFKKTNLGSLTDNIFAYLNKNPNRKIKIDELREATEETIRDLPKVIENAGFTGNLSRTFFRVSKTAIFFRQQITKIDFKKLNIDLLNLEF